MCDKIKNIVVTSVFSAFLAFFAIMCVYGYFNPETTSIAERRPLAQFPEEITWEGIVDKTDISKFESASVDQFPFREFFRGIKANFQYNVLGLKENNKLTIIDGQIIKVENTLYEDSLNAAGKKFNTIYNRYLKGKNTNVYFSIIPDKSYFAGEQFGYPSVDYDKLIEIMKENLSEMEYIDIMNSLELSDYYKTDTHWSQDKILDVAEKISAVLGVEFNPSGYYDKHEIADFNGVYAGQSAINPNPDKIVYLSNEILDACTVFDYETGKTISIYDLEKADGDDAYEVFLSGSKVLLRIENPNATTDKSLVVFRDSFGSSLAPLLAEGYKTIYVADIRYMSPYQLCPMIGDFTDMDVLFIYSASVINSPDFNKTFK